MESKELVYKYGHFYDNATHQRLALREGANIRIAALASDFITTSPVGKWPKDILDAKAKEAAVKAEKNLKGNKKICEQGTFLYFSIPRTKNKIRVNHEFKVKLLEDLYVYIKEGQDKDRLYDCTCTVIENISNTIDFFEEIKAKSLNEAYKNTYVHFFGNKGNPACNALDRFYEKPHCEDLTIGRNRITA